MYRHATDHKWTIDELVKTVHLIKSADFKVEDVNVDLHKRVAAAISQGKSNSHNIMMRESDLDCDQDLTFWANFWLRTLKDVLREILRDERMDGHQEFKFEISKTEEGERLSGITKLQLG